jgi:hypothetical protein
MKADKEAADKAAKESADNAKAVQAKAMVEGFAKLGKIKNDEATIKAWTDKAVADHDGVKKMLEEIPVNKVSNKITADTTTMVSPLVTYRCRCYGRCASKIAQKNKPFHTKPI